MSIDLESSDLSALSSELMTVALSMEYMFLEEPQAPTVSVFNGYHNWNNINSDDGMRKFDNLGGVRVALDEINADTGEPAATVVINGSVATVVITGSPSEVVEHRMKILQQYYKIGYKYLSVDSRILESKSDNQLLITQLDLIASYTTTTIFITSTLPKDFQALESERNENYILIYGDTDSVSLAHTRVSLTIDNLNGSYIDRISVPLSIIPLLAGRDLVNFKTLAKDTNTKLYLPPLFPEIFSSMDKTHARREYDEIYISGSEIDVDSLRSDLESLIAKTTVYSKDFVIPAGKVDHLLVNNLDELEKLSYQHQAFIQLPYLGSGKTEVRVQCSSHIFVESTIRSIAKLTCEIYSADYWLSEGHSDENGYVVPPKELPSLSLIRENIQRISAASTTAITYLNGAINVLGKLEFVKSAITQINGLSIWPTEIHQVRFRIELSVDQREFIAGKKNGKINRIMTLSRVHLKFLPFTEYNFLIDLVSGSYAEAQYGLQLLEGELPAEISFYVPEAYHRNIIGPSGHQIQVLMRKYNVFVKFTNPFEKANGVPDIPGANPSPIDNVVIRCPAKNKTNLEPARQGIMEYVDYFETHPGSNSSSSGLAVAGTGPGNGMSRSRR
ncbi:uncharacterized protein V1516DRAFT_619486 [Lipomyces oligophaga]|uniref:uncharacterized protein n=1 Tax=Lipomyces oligophaga TaxID=45792 RepID=UPI0034CDE98F